MSEIILRSKIHPADIETIIERHWILYEKEYGFDRTFRAYVTDSLQVKIECIWIAERDETFAGCIGVVEADKKTAQLRWLLVEPASRNLGLGRTLMQKLIDYCKEKKYELIFLWTVNKLPAARSLYEGFGFQLNEQRPEKMLWGQKLIEERWDLSL